MLTSKDNVRWRGAKREREVDHVTKSAKRLLISYYDRFGDDIPGRDSYCR